MNTFIHRSIVMMDGQMILVKLLRTKTPFHFIVKTGEYTGIRYLHFDCLVKSLNVSEGPSPYQ